MRYVIRSTMDAYMIVQMHNQLSRELRDRRRSCGRKLYVQDGLLYLDLTADMSKVAPDTLEAWKSYLEAVA